MNPAGRGVTRGLALNVHGEAEARLDMNKIYGIGKTAIGAGFQQFSFRDPNDPANDQVGHRARVHRGHANRRRRRLRPRRRRRRSDPRATGSSRMLDDARALGKPIDAATAKKLQLTWWALRGERTTLPLAASRRSRSCARRASCSASRTRSITYEIMQRAARHAALHASERLRRPAHGQRGLPQAAERHGRQLRHDLRPRRAGDWRAPATARSCRTTSSSCRATRIARYRLFAGDGSHRRGRSAQPRACAASRTASTANRSARSTCAARLTALERRRR